MIVVLFAITFFLIITQGKHTDGRDSVLRKPPQTKTVSPNNVVRVFLHRGGCSCGGGDSGGTGQLLPGTCIRFRAESALRCGKAEYGMEIPILHFDSGGGSCSALLSERSGGNSIQTVFMFVARLFLFTLHESPRYLVHAGRPQDAVIALREIIRANGDTLEIGIDDVDDSLLNSQDPQQEVSEMRGR